MAYTVKKIDVWTGDIGDRPGGLTAKLDPIGAAGADLTFIVARRKPDDPGRGVVYLGPLMGAKQAGAAKSAGLRRATELTALHLEGPNKPGSASQVTHILAGAGINLRGLSAATIGNKFMLVLAFDSAAIADEALKLLKAAGKGKGRK